MAVAHGVAELLWLKIIFSDLGIKADALMRLFCDSKATLAYHKIQFIINAPSTLKFTGISFMS
ncbi:hypothetical protein PJI17_33050, partial [Mycobacterium kansasii]